MANRNKGLDVARGMVMFYIITIIHGVYWLGIFESNFSSLLLFEMPLIFMISGYAYAITVKRKHIRDLYDYFEYAQSRVIRIYIPYLAYAFVCALIVILIQEMDNTVDTVLSWINPVTRGKGHSWSALTWHLWFIPPFLIVTLCLPMVNFAWVKKIPLWFSFLLLFIFLYLANTVVGSKLSTPLFYFFWAYVGFKLGSGLIVNRVKLVVVGLVSVIGLVLSGILLQLSFDMQFNKFPPNLMFIWFSCVWVAILLFGCSYIPAWVYDYLVENKFIAIFINKGYSIYLWQGLGYSLAKVVQVQYELNVYLVWVIAIVMSILLGYLFSPLETIKWKLPVNRKKVN